MATFTWSPDYGASADEAPLVDSAKYGEGYEQRAEIGINNVTHNWRLVFSARDTTEALAILSFFRANKTALNSFDWVDPDGNTGKFVCRNWNYSIDFYNTYTVNAVFEKVYEQ